MYKILVLKNRLDVDIKDDCSKAVQYFYKHGIKIEFDFKDINIPIKVKEYSRALNGQVYLGIEDSVKDNCDQFVPKGQYHVSVLAWNTKDVPKNDNLPTSWTNWSPLTWTKADTEFVQLITNDNNDKTDWIYNSIVHEIMHTFCKRLNRRGLNVLDEMDVSQGVNYLHNEDPDHIDGNFARTFKNLEPHKDKLYDFYFISKEKPVLDVKQLQRDLKALGYFKYPLITGIYGSITKSAVRALQQATGLVSDGIAGPITLKAIKSALDVKKKPKTLVEALIQVESNGNDFAIGDHHLKNKAYGCLQIRKPVCDDVNKWLEKKVKPEDMLGNRELSIKVFGIYMDIYCDGFSDEHKARCWNGGPLGYKKKSTEIYWQKVSKVLYN